MVRRDTFRPWLSNSRFHSEAENHLHVAQKGVKRIYGFHQIRLLREVDLLK